MRRRSILPLWAALALLLTACSGPPEENTGSPPPPSEGEGPGQVTSQEPLQPSHGPLVYTDWSGLEAEPPAEALYKRWYDAPVDRLLPVRGGYGGALIPFEGTLQEGTWEMQMVRYGLATADGTVVCDPVYSQVRTEGDYLLLDRTDLTERYDVERDWDVKTQRTVAAPDGSWVLPGDYRRVCSMSDGRLLLVDQAGRVWFCDGAGTLTLSPLDGALNGCPEIEREKLVEWTHFEDGMGLYPDISEEGEQTGSWLLDAEAGMVRYLSGVIDCWGWSDGVLLTPGRSVDGSCGYLDRNGDWAIPPQFTWTGPFSGSCADVELKEGGNALIDRTGRVVLQVGGYLYMATDRSGSIYYLDRIWNENGETVTAVYDVEGRLLPDHPLTGRDVILYDCAATTVEDQKIGNLTVKNGLMTLWDYDGTVLGTIEGAQGLSLQGCENGRAVLYRWEAEKGGNGGIYDLENGAWVVPLGEYSYVWVETDGTDTVYAARREYEDGFDILREDGTCIAHVDRFSGFTQGLFQCRRGDAAVWLDLNGEEVFRWPILTNSD